MLTAPLAIAAFCLATHASGAQPDGTVPAAAPQPPAQAAAPSEGVVQLLKNGKPRFELLDVHGVRHKASLVQIDGDNVVLRSRDGVFTVAAAELQRSDRRGDRPWDGALVGLSVGLGIWGLIAESDPGLDWKEDNPDDWTLKDTITLLCFSTTVGYIVDALHVGKHTVLVGPMRTNTSKPKPALTLNIAGPPRERRVQLGYRVTF